MIRTILQPFTALWRAVVGYHRQHIDPATDPDVRRLVEQQHQSERRMHQINIVEQQYLGRRGSRHADHL